MVALFGCLVEVGRRCTQDVHTDMCAQVVNKLYTCETLVSFSTQQRAGEEGKIIYNCCLDHYFIEIRGDFNEFLSPFGCDEDFLRQRNENEIIML